MALPHDGSQAQISNLELPNVAVDEDVTAVQVSVDDAGVVGVQIMEASENLHTPFLECLRGHVAVLVSVVPEAARGACLGDEVDSVGVGIFPEVVEGYDVVVLESLEQLDLGSQPGDDGGIAAEVPEPDLVPRHVPPFMLVEPSVNFLHCSAA